MKKKKIDYAWILYSLILAFAVFISLPSCAPIYSEKSRDVRSYVGYMGQNQLGYVYRPQQVIHINEEWVTNPDSTEPFIGKWVSYNQMRVDNYPGTTLIFSQDKMEIYHRVDGVSILYKTLYE